MAPLEVLIRERAYQLWIAEGRPYDRDNHHWTAAAEQVQADEHKARAAAQPSRGGALTKRAKSAKEAAARYRALLENQGRKSFHQHVLLALRHRETADRGKRTQPNLGRTHLPPRLSALIGNNSGELELLGVPPQHHGRSPSCF